MVLQECVLCLTNLLQLSCICVACESMLNIGAQSVRSCLATSANCTGAWEKIVDKLPFATSGICPIHPYRINTSCTNDHCCFLNICSLYLGSRKWVVHAYSMFHMHFFTATSGLDIPVHRFLTILRQLSGRSTHHARQSQNLTCLLICICSYKSSVTASYHSLAHRGSSVERQSLLLVLIPCPACST